MTSAPERPVVRLSVIVLVHDVAPYVGACLDSVLASRSDAIELIAVDDASTDGSRRLLDDAARRDGRVRVVGLDRNVGQGAARNRGLDAASGAHVWFVDGDDEVVPGAVDAVLDALDEQAVDVLLVDHERLHPDGRTEARPALGGGSSAGSRALAAVPDREPLLLATTPYIWDKVLRRVFLDEEGLRFTGRWYEDQRMAALVLVLGRTFGALGACGYRYRQRPGSATRTVGERHFESIEQWEAVFAHLSGHPALEQHREQLVERMATALLRVLDRTDRIPAHRRARYFHEVSRLYRAQRPVGAAGAGRSATERGKATLLRLGSYAAYRSSQIAKAVLVRARGSAAGRWRGRRRRSRRR